MAFSHSDLSLSREILMISKPWELNSLWRATISGFVSRQIWNEKFFTVTNGREEVAGVFGKL